MAQGLSHGDRSSELAMSTPSASLRFGGVILCGGQGVRMGRPKAAMPFGPESLVARVARLLGEVVQPVVVVAAAGQELPPLPQGVEIAKDRRAGRGPLEGLAAGLSALSGRVDAAFVTGCDVPLLKPEFVRRMVNLLGQHAIAVPEVAGGVHPLAGIYRLSVATQADRLLGEGRLESPICWSSSIPVSSAPMNWPTSIPRSIRCGT